MVRRQSAACDQIDFATLGVLAATTEGQGRPLGNIDGLLAATGIEHGLTVATRNVRDFDYLGSARAQSLEKLTA